MKSKKTFPLLQEQLLILKELQFKSAYHHLEVLDHELILNSNTLHTLPLGELQNTQTPRALEFYLEPKSSRQLQILRNHGKPPRSEVGWRERGLACKAQILPKSLARAAGKHQDCRPKVPTRAPGPCCGGEEGTAAEWQTMIPEGAVMGSVGHTPLEICTTVPTSLNESSKAVLSPDSSFSPHLPVVT